MTSSLKLIYELIQIFNYLQKENDRRQNSLVTSVLPCRQKNCASDSSMVMHSAITLTCKTELTAHSSKT